MKTITLLLLVLALAGCKMYGAALNTWIKARNTILPASLQRYVFSNAFMKRCGLAEPMPIVPGGPIV